MNEKFKVQEFTDEFINELINNKIYEIGNDECLEEKEELWCFIETYHWSIIKNFYSFRNSIKDYG